MIQWLLRASLQHRWMVLFAATALMIVGVLRAAQMPIDVFPDLTAPRVAIVTESTGMASEEVEQLITFPIEAAVNGAAGVRRVRSASAPGISVVWAEFDWDTSNQGARQTVTERLQSVSGNLPPEASAPLLAPASSVMGEIAFVALTSDTLTPLELRRIADVTVRRRLLSTAGISQAVPIGGAVKQYQVLVDPQRAEQYGLSLTEVVEAVTRGTANAPGGYVVDGGQESVVRVLGRADSVEELGAIVLARRGDIPVRVRDVADVLIGPGVARGAASYNATPAVLVSIVKQPTAGTSSTTRKLDETLDDLAQDLAPLGVALHRDIFRQQDFIDRAIKNVVEVLRDGALLVVLVLWLFLWSLRPTLISALAVPLSLLVAVLVLDFFGFSIDTMTLGGLAIAIGELVDDAIVDVENVVRHMRLRARLPEAERQPVIATVLRASVEIRSAIVSATWVIMLVFVPLLLLGGLEGRLLRPLAVAYLVAIFASLLVAVTVTPVLCSFLLRSSPSAGASDGSPLMRAIIHAYRPVLRWTIERPRSVTVATLALVVLGATSLAGFGRSFLPEFNEGSLTINMVLSPGTSLAESDALATMAEKTLLDDPWVRAVGRRSGRAERDEHVLGVETSELEVHIAPEDPRPREQVFEEIRERLRAVPGAHFTIGQPISHRIEHMMSGQRAAISLKLYGENLHQLRQSAEAVKAAIAPIPGLVDVGVEQVVEIPQLDVRINAPRAANYGLSPGAAATLVGTALWGKEAARVYEDGSATPVVVKYSADALASPEAVARMRLQTPSGALVPVAALADVEISSGPNYVLRENVERRIVVTANVAGRDESAVHDELLRAIDQGVELPAGVRLEATGQFERQQESNRRLMLFGALSILGIALVVGSTLRSVRRTLIVLVNLPLALTGGVVGVYLAGGVLSIATTIGFITLFGIATRNGILLGTRTRDLELEGQTRSSAARAAAEERLAPILMTALTAALGLLPLGLSVGEPGSEIQAPMALVILTGLASSTLLNMLVIPTLLAHWGGVPERPGETIRVTSD